MFSVDIFAASISSPLLPKGKAGRARAIRGWLPGVPALFLNSRACQRRGLTRQILCRIAARLQAKNPQPGLVSKSVTGKHHIPAPEKSKP